MSADRVALSDEERAARQTLDAENISHWLYHNTPMMPRECDELAAKILDSEWLAARESKSPASHEETHEAVPR